MKKFLTATLLILPVTAVIFGGVGLYYAFFDTAHADCRDYSAKATEKLKLAQTETDKSRAQRLQSEADDAQAGARTVCQISRENSRTGMYFGVGASFLLVIFAALLLFSRKSTDGLN